MSKKIRLGFCLFLSCCLMSCNDNSNTPIGEQSDNIVIKVTEEELYEQSDVICVIEAKVKGDAYFYKPYWYTEYSFVAINVLKGELLGNSVYLSGNTTDDSNMRSSVEESMVIGETYKIFLKRIDIGYITTATAQSIFKITPSD